MAAGYQEGCPGRTPTSHERRTGESWDASYQDGPAPWDLGRSQPAVVRLAQRGGFIGSVLDAGCGTGENALHLAALGLPVLGFDVAPAAIASAQAKAVERGLSAEFVLGDALQLSRLGRRFDTVLDCGLFHTFDPQERERYADSLATVVEAGGTLHVLCFSDEGADLGPHPVGRQELQAFAAEGGWALRAVVSERVGTRYHGDLGAPGWLATFGRL